MKKTGSLITLEKAKNIISDYVSYKTETINTQNALGRCLAQDLTAPENFPAFKRSLYDGFAVNSKKHRVGVQNFEPLRIATGQILPVGADSVVMLEDAKITGNKITFSSRIRPGQNVIHAGEDLRKGEFILNKGFLLRPQDIGLLQGLGIKNIKVFKKLSAGIVSSGNELVFSDKIPGYGQVRDMNSGMLFNLVLRSGGEPVLLGICPDKKEEIKKFIGKLNKFKLDLILFTGGTSVGNSDILEEALSSLHGSKILFHGLKTKPGKPALAGFWKDRLIIGLPGRPSSAFVVFHLLVKPVLRYFRGPFNMLEVVLKESISSNPEVEEYVPVLIEQKKGTLYAWPMRAKPSLFSPLIFSQGAIKIPIGRKIIKKGQVVKALLWNDL
ncbi:MAG: molybdopterin molybdotransferase MoeA [bacterium]|nr:molybdopterin molybdotransferase MoeA [bacterium]